MRLAYKDLKSGSSVEYASKKYGIPPKRLNAFHRKVEEAVALLKENPALSYNDLVKLGYKNPLLRFFRINELRELAGVPQVPAPIGLKRLSEEEWEERGKELLGFIRENPNCRIRDVKKVGLCSTLDHYYGRNLTLAKIDALNISRISPPSIPRDEYRNAVKARLKILFKKGYTIKQLSKLSGIPGYTLYRLLKGEPSRKETYLKAGEKLRSVPIYFSMDRYLSWDKGQQAWDFDQRKLMEDLHFIGPIIGTEFVLSFPDATKLIAPETGGISIASVVCLRAELPIALARKDTWNEDDVARCKGTELYLTPGCIGPGEKVAFVDDFIRTGRTYRACGDYVRRRGAHFLGGLVAVAIGYEWRKNVRKGETMRYLDLVVGQRKRSREPIRRRKGELLSLALKIMAEEFGEVNKKHIEKLNKAHFRRRGVKISWDQLAALRKRLKKTFGNELR
jgi:adenine/guanine phosphoribosyltransferase-like PRPP-binding protein